MISCESLLPDFVFIIIKFIKETFRMSQFQSPDTRTNASWKFGSEKKKKRTSRQDCKLESFQQLSSRDTYYNSNTNGLAVVNASSKSMLNPNASNGIESHNTAYDNPTFERDTSLKNTSPLRTQL